MDNTVYFDIESYYNNPFMNRELTEEEKQQMEQLVEKLKELSKGMDIQVLTAKPPFDDDHLWDERKLGAEEEFAKPSTLTAADVIISLEEAVEERKEKLVAIHGFGRRVGVVSMVDAMRAVLGSPLGITNFADIANVPVDEANKVWNESKLRRGKGHDRLKKRKSKGKKK